MGEVPPIGGDELQVLNAETLDDLFGALRRRGYTVVGPKVRDEAIVYDELASAADLPRGLTDSQDGGTYRLEQRDDEAMFGYAVGPHSWKRFLHPPTLRLWKGRRRQGAEDEAFSIEEEEPEDIRYAFIGVRSCELHAIAIQDRVLADGSFPDPHYVARRQGAFIVALNCSQAGGTCFCVSMDTGPRAESGYDLALTEVVEGDRHYFTLEVGSPAGAEVADELSTQAAGEAEAQAATAVIERTAASMGRSMETEGLKELLYRNYEHPRWDEVSERCLTCGNCTMVCPTCFCTTVEDVTDLAQEETERWRQWDSCFTIDFSHVHGGSVRSSPRSRYRQWMTHKLATWWDQFGTSGCVGCGRCITWCPVAIDITEEAAAIRATDGDAGTRPTETEGTG